MEKISYHKELYSKFALLKAAYHFTDRYYIYLDQDETSYLIELTEKSGVDGTHIRDEFSNEILAQAAREEILHKTAHIRELILGRAFGSTIINKQYENEQSEPDKEQELLSDGADPFADWYEHGN